MAVGTGVTTITFGDDARSAVYKTETVVTDSVSEPHNFKIGSVTGSGINTRNKIAYSNGIFVSTSQGTQQDTIAYYPDGTYTASAIGSAQAWQLGGDAIGTTGFIVIAPAIGTHRVSSDGVNWSFRSSVWAAVTYSDPVFGNGKWVTTINGAGTDHATVSADGYTVTLYNNLTLKTYGGVIFDGNYFVTWTSNQVYRSSDGITWSGGITLPNYNSQIIYTNNTGTTVSVSSNITADYVYVSTDGFATYQTYNTPFTMPTRLVIYADGYWYFYGTAHTRVTYTSDFINWEEKNLVPWIDDWRIAYGSGTFMMISRSASVSSRYWWSKKGRYFDDNVRTVTTPSTLVESAKAKVGSNITKVTVTGQTGITNTSAVEAFIMGSDSTSSHNTMEHQLAEISVSIENIIPDVGFDIVATSMERLTGDFKVRYVWST